MRIQRAGWGRRRVLQGGVEPRCLAERLRDSLSPVGPGSHGILVADDKPGADLLGQGHHDLVGPAQAYDQRNASAVEGARGIEQVPIVPPLRTRVVGRGAEDRQHRNAERIAEIDREVERRVVHAAPGSLHPVEDATALRMGRSERAARNRGWVARS